jgi:hypothetical protein
MKVNRIKISSLLLCLFFAPTFIGCGSAGGESPQTSIPAPVSHLSISSPDSDDLVRITADVGFTDASSTVTFSNPLATTSLWDYVIANAYALVTQTLTSNADGSFQGTIQAAIGDVVTVSYTINGVTTSQDLTVPDNVPPLPATADIQDVSIDPNTGKALVVANDGTDGFVYVIDLANKTFEATLTLPGASGATRIATDPTTGDSIVLDTVNIDALHIRLTNGVPVLVANTAIIPSSDVAAGPAGNYVLIAHTDPSPAISFFNLSTNSPTTTGDSQSEAGVDQASALFIATAFDGTNDRAAVLSQMPDSSLLITTHTINEGVPSIAESGATVVTATTPGGLYLFASATEALFTDASANTVQRVDLSGGGSTAITVGNSPSGVVVDETNQIAFVVNNGDRNVSIIALSDNAVTTTEDVGLEPTQIAIASVSGTPTIIVINTGDETATIY